MPPDLGQMQNTASPTKAHLSRRFLGLALLGAGVVLLGVAGTYYGYGYFASRNLDRLVYQAQVETESTGEGTLGMRSASSSEGAAGAVVGPSPAAYALYPGGLIPVRRWADPRGTQAWDQGSLLDGFTPVQRLGDPLVEGQASAAHRITIPALDIEAEVEELRVVNLLDSRAYETPKFTVGHILTTPNPGAAGNGWFFGHLESPLQGEGNVFSRLPEIPALLRNGEDVYVVVESEEQRHLYQVTETDLIHEDDLDLYEADDSRLTLVTCFPRLKYDYRLLVTAKLAGSSDPAQPTG